MPKAFSPATAEQVVAVSEAAVVLQDRAEISRISEFTDLSASQSENALTLSCHLGLLSEDEGIYRPASPLSLFLSSPNEGQKAAVVRVILESYDPFVMFRNRLRATSIAARAGRQTKAALDLDAHHDEIKDTLVSLGTYSQALQTEGGGKYHPADATLSNALLELADAASDTTAAEGLVRRQIGDAVELLPADSVIAPLSDAFQKARSGDADGAVQQAGNAIESYLDHFGELVGTPVADKPGVNAKIDGLSQTGDLPKKLKHMGKYLGHLRNAADHGNDPETGATWDVSEQSGIEFVFVGCSFIRSTMELHTNGVHRL